ncbi:hypothetical protein ABK040_007188 [Willaertia magna]
MNKSLPKYFYSYNPKFKRLTTIKRNYHVKVSNSEPEYKLYYEAIYEGMIYGSINCKKASKILRSVSDINIVDDRSLVFKAIVDGAMYGSRKCQLAVMSNLMYP